MILAIQNDRLNIFYKNHENVDRRYDVNAGNIMLMQVKLEKFNHIFLKIILKMRRRQRFMLFSFEEIS